MNEKDYCETCNLYTMQNRGKETNEQGNVEEVWNCPVCESYKTNNTSK